MEHSLIDAYLFRQRIILIFVFGFLSSVLVSSFVFIPPLLSILAFVMAGAILLSERVWNGELNKEVLTVVIILVSISLGSLRYNVKDFHIPNQELESQVGSLTEIVGVVLSEPEVRDNSTRFIIKSGGEKILVNAELYTNAWYGDEVKVRGKLEKPGNIDDGVGRSFDYAAYLSKDDIFLTLNFADTEVLSSGHGNPVKSFLFNIKRNFVSHVREILSEPHASLLAGLLVSGKDAMPKSILEEFRRAGVIHIVVLSGYNITIIAEFIKRFFEKTSGFLKLNIFPHSVTLASIIGIFLFVLMTGAEATVVRAAIMVLVVMLAKVFGRNYSAPRALLGAAFLMVMINPKILVFDPSFQLSFLATSALIYVVPIVEKFLKNVPDKWGLKTILSTTLGTQILVLPYLVYSTGEISLVSLIANILILAFIPLTMLIGFIATMLSYISTVLALPFSYLVNLLLSWILGVSKVLSSLSIASVKVTYFPWWSVVIIYTVIIWLVTKEPGKTPDSLELAQ
jgi:competence protein ComEC